MRAAIFDIEGTLVDAVPLTLQCWQETLAAFGQTVPPETLQLYSGMDGDEMLRILLPALDAMQRKTIARREGETFKRDFLRQVKPFNGVVDLFEQLHSEGVMIALASDADAEEVAHYRKLIDADDLIDVIVCGSDVKIGKPDASLVRRTIERVRVRPADAIMIGDTPSDAQAARAAGAPALGVLSGGFSSDALKQAGCFKVADDLEGVDRILMQILQDDAFAHAAIVSPDIQAKKRAG